MPYTTQTSSANSPNTITLGVSGTQRQRVFRVDAFSSSGTSQLTIKDGAMEVWKSPTGWIASTGISSFAPTYPVVGSSGNALVVEALTAGVGNTTTLNVHYEPLGP